MELENREGKIAGFRQGQESGVNMEADEVLGWSLLAALIAFLTAGVIWCSVALVKTTSTDGGIDFCMIEYVAPLYRVWGHRPWRGDVTVAVVQSMEAATDAATAAHCPLGKP